ncbi:hypothetical protein CISG_02843 [Coccidioides immitis RMSCC 3703]|uniref:Uncharacterized protein n=1 Tax=Coccidioides immitis RMSCC 3703 TaxID=454286 RepID=A0A0J8RD51_COCIT|nr:hypothetical protein CISG_02843 [Coccidioides immitis RMSCC 3703]
MPFSIRYIFLQKAGEDGQSTLAHSAGGKSFEATWTQTVEEESDTGLETQRAKGSQQQMNWQSLTHHVRLLLVEPRKFERSSAVQARRNEWTQLSMSLVSSTELARPPCCRQPSSVHIAIGKIPAEDS